MLNDDMSYQNFKPVQILHDISVYERVTSIQWSKICLVRCGEPWLAADANFNESNDTVSSSQGEAR